MIIINGRKVANQLNRQTAHQVANLATRGIVPKLAVIMVGNDPANLLYVHMKDRMAKRLKIHSIITHLSNQIGQSQLSRLITQYNQDYTIDGILVQLPLPSQINERIIDYQIKPTKDVDGFNPVNMGRLFLHEAGDYTKSADVIISATGQINLISGSDIKPGCTIIDVGENHDANGKLVGDVNFASAKRVAGKITPIPGGVGPMTIATLMRQTVELCKLHHNLKI